MAKQLASSATSEPYSIASDAKLSRSAVLDGYLDSRAGRYGADPISDPTAPLLVHEDARALTRGRDAIRHRAALPARRLRTTEPRRARPSARAAS